MTHPTRPPLHLMMTTDTVGGVWTYALDLATELGKAGVRTTLVTLGPEPDEAQRAAAKVIPNLDIISCDAPLDWTAHRPETIALAGTELARLARKVGADVVQLNAAAYLATARFAQPVVVAHHSCVLTWWQAMHPDEPLPEDFVWRTELTSVGLKRASAIIAPSIAFAQAVGKAYELPSPPLAIPNGRSCPACHPAEREAMAVTIGRLWDPAKNVAVLEQAAQTMRHPVVALGPLAGPNGDLVTLEHVRWGGNLSAASLRDFLPRAAVFVSAARYEPFGLGVLEAAQAGCALVLSDIPTFRELWDGAAVFVSPTDAEAIASAIESLLADPARLAMLGQAARERSGHYSSADMASRMLSLYHAVTDWGSLEQGSLEHSVLDHAPIEQSEPDPGLVEPDPFEQMLLTVDRVNRERG